MERALAHIEKVENIRNIEGADNIQACNVLGWSLICKKGEFKDGDLCVYFEIDSKVPEDDERYAFLSSKHYKIKTMKISKFNVWSQGLAMPLSMFPELSGLPVGTDVTEKLHVVYSLQEDNIRKRPLDPNEKYKDMASSHKKLFATRPVRWMMKHKWGRQLLFMLFKRNKSALRDFPAWISKTDETRIENIPWMLGNSNMYTCTEKLDGTSITLGVRRIKRRFRKDTFEFVVCSRNVRMMEENQECYHATNIYWEMAKKYDAKNHLIQWCKENGYDSAVIQGEGIGNVQGNPYKLKENDMYVFNLVHDGIRMTTESMAEWCDIHNFKHVPILSMHYRLPEDMETMKLSADGKSVVNPSVSREGIVYRNEMNPMDSFKNVSRMYLLKHEG